MRVRILKDVVIIYVTAIVMFIAFSAVMSYCDNNSTNYQCATISLFIKKKNPKIPKHTREEIAHHIVARSQDANVCAVIIAAIACVESRYDQSAVGPCGEIGIMQIYDNQCMGLDIQKILLSRIDYNIMIGVCKLVEKLIEVDGDMHQAIARYNGAGPGALVYRDKVISVIVELIRFEIANRDSIRQYVFG